ncbi:DNA recombination protein RmuC [Thiolapillus brandeum]|nr:DNA recombination protein RmuC [Thiolapillus brandeum]
MQNLQAFWSQYSQEIILSGILLTIFGLAWLLWTVHQQRSQLHRLSVELEEMAAGLYSALEGQHQTINDGFIRNQLLSQEGVHRSMNDLQETLGQRQAVMQRQLSLDASVMKEALLERFIQLQRDVSEQLGAQRESFEKRQAEALDHQHKALRQGMEHVSSQLHQSQAEAARTMNERLESLANTTDKRLQQISGQVEKRLTEGFEKTTEVFGRVLEHLSRIDEAQKKITELSGNVVSLQEVLNDKRSRGAFGEVQLEGLIRNVMPEGSYAMQETLSNGMRVDCLLTLPEPTGRVPVDAKFPLESYQRMMDNEASEGDRRQARRQFAQDIKKHIQDIAGKYLIPGETADGAVMFLPAESLFAEIHAHFPELVETAQRARVWLVSPTTLMAVLTTARAVIKDVATRKQVHIIQEHLRMLSADFGRFQKRMDKLADHIRMAHDDVKQVNTSAQKISGRFVKIEKVELDDLEEDPLLPGN